VEQRWGPERYETWLAQLLIQHLLASRGRDDGSFETDRKKGGTS